MTLLIAVSELKNDSNSERSFSSCTSRNPAFSSVCFGVATLLRVIDGDTLKIEIAGQKETIRLIGIDTPESKANKKALKDAQRSRQDVGTITAMGRQAKVFVKTLVRKGEPVRIEFDVQPRDKYGRLLGYVYLQDGRAELLG